MLFNQQQFLYDSKVSSGMPGICKKNRTAGNLRQQVFQPNEKQIDGNSYERRFNQRFKSLRFRIQIHLYKLRHGYLSEYDSKFIHEGHWIPYI